MKVIQGGVEVAWTSNWAEHYIEGHQAFVAPKLYLCQDLVHVLVAGISYAAAFLGSTIESKPFMVLHAQFDLYMRGEPQLSNFAAILDPHVTSMAELSQLITKTSKLLQTKD